MKTDEGAEAHINVKTMNIWKNQLCSAMQHNMNTPSGSIMVFRYSLNLGMKLY